MVSELLQSIISIVFTERLETFALIFLGCCSNAITLEQFTSRYPGCGTLLTFFQFSLVSLYGLRRYLTLAPILPHHEPDEAQDNYQALLVFISQEICNLRNSFSDSQRRLLCIAISGDRAGSDASVQDTSFGDDLARCLCKDPGSDVIVRFSSTDLVIRGTGDSAALGPVESWLSTWPSPRYFDPEDYGHYDVYGPSMVTGEGVGSEGGVVIVDLPSDTQAKSISLMHPWDARIILYPSSEKLPDLTPATPSLIVVDISTKDAAVVRPQGSHSFHASARPSEQSLVSHVLRRFPVPRLKPTKVPLFPYFSQVLLFYAISLLNNAAFGYSIPMPVHIIFRSGGLVVGMLLGLAVGKRYSKIQMLSVVVVTAGVIITTLSTREAKNISRSSGRTSIAEGGYYTLGIAILTLALFLSGILGLLQDWTSAQYVHGTVEIPTSSPNISGKERTDPDRQRPPWQESMFYLHFLAMPLFWFVRRDLSAQFFAVHSGDWIELPIGFPEPLRISPAISLQSNHWMSFKLPAAYIPLFFNTLTQLVCVSGVHRLTSRVSSLTVTLVLVVRKAVSLIISAVFLNGVSSSSSAMWIGASMVLLGTVGYSLGGAPKLRNIKTPPLTAHTNGSAREKDRID